jgi:tetratricopeptide (TPR) repeat protein
LRVVLSPTAVAATRAGRMEDPRAHDLYLRGVFEKNKLSAQGLANAVGFFEQALAIDSNYARAAMLGAMALAMRDHPVEALRQKQWVGPFTIAAVYASVGDRDHAMQWLEQAFREKDWQLRTMLNFDSPYLRSLAGDPRYVALRKKVLATAFRS